MRSPPLSHFWNGLPGVWHSHPEPRKTDGKQICGAESETAGSPGVLRCERVRGVLSIYTNIRWAVRDWEDRVLSAPVGAESARAYVRSGQGELGVREPELTCPVGHFDPCVLISREISAVMAGLATRTQVAEGVLRTSQGKKTGETKVCW
jgi:hypothetical protein